MDLRQTFLDYFAAKGHTINPSVHLVPDDPSLLFVNAGMVAFKPVFTGEIPTPTPPRATSSQLCLRAGGKHNDLDNVGYTARHHTLFEMLGNFSFGDYFKTEAIDFAWEFVTEVVGLDKSRLWISVHDSDDEAFELWLKHVPAERIKRMGDKDNFWQMGDTGPCGPCSEIHFDQGADHFNSAEDYFGGDGDRFLEIWNLVFMQYNRTEDGTLHPLPKPSIDTGMGLERITAIKEGKFSNYDTSIFMPIIESVAQMTGKPYVYDQGASYRVIADHSRAVTFLVSQGVTFDKEGRGYVLRRILRRAVRHGYMLGLREPFMYKLAQVVADINKASYPYLQDKMAFIQEQIKLEEERFFATIENGMKLFEEALADTKEIFDGAVAFKLYDTFGFPLDLTQDMLREKGIGLDEAGFNAQMQEQRERAKAAWKGSGDAAKDGDFKAALEQFGENSFVGYDRAEERTKILALFDENMRMTDALAAGSTGWVMLENTPFYATSGGQKGDTGELEGFASVLQTEKFFGLNLSEISLTKALSTGTDVLAKVAQDRKEIARHHSATHLLHAALGKVLGESAQQAGSYVDANRLRFDFSYPKAVSSEQLAEIETWVNRQIATQTHAATKVMTLEEAQASGAKALFGEKYGETVRVVTIGSDSVEFCGGTHVDNPGEIGSFIITKESGVSAGVRRIEAVCSQSAYRYTKALQGEIDDAKEALKSPHLAQGIAKLQEQVKALKAELKAAQASAATEIKAEAIGGVNVIVEEVKGGDIQKMIDDAKAKYEKLAILLMQENGGKVRISTGSQGCSIHAGNWLKEVAEKIGGKGGGRPDFASGGGTNPEGMGEAKVAALAYLKANLA